MGILPPMRWRITALAFLAGFLPAVAAAQSPPFPGTLPANTIVGRLGIGSGPSQAIPISVLTAQIQAGITSVSSVGLSMPGIFSVSGSPITTSGTLAVTASGTSGGIPYFSSTTTLASSGALTANLPVIGGGAGAAPTVGTRSGNTTAFATISGSLTSGNCIKSDASGNLVDQGSTCGGGGGGGTPGGSDTQVQYNSAGSFAGSANLTWSSPALSIGVAGSTTGLLKMTGSTSGVITLQGQAAAGTYNWNWPTGAGSSGQFLTSAGGGSSAMTFDNLSSHIAIGTNVGLSTSGTTTVTIGATTDDLRVNSLGLNNAAPTQGRLQQTLSANNITGHLIKRSTDTSPTGKFADYQNAAGTSVHTVDITGAITVGSYTATIIDSTYGGTGINNAGRTLTISNNSGTLSFGNASKTLTVNNTITLTGTDGTVWTGASSSMTLAALNLTGQTITGGAGVTSQSQSTGNITIDCTTRPLQYITNNGAWTITAPSNDGSCIFLITNGASAATPTFSGFTVGSNTGDSLTNTNTNKFMLWVGRINGTSSYQIKALQ